MFVSGSIAYDYIMKYEGVFKDALLKKNLGNLNVSFTGKNKKMFYGGCGANICYNFALFGGHGKSGLEAMLFGVAGKDFKQYWEKLKQDGVNCALVGIDESGFTASAYVLTDRHENQITIFSPGAMENKKAEKVLSNKMLKSLEYAILSPDICERTARLGRKLNAAGVRWFFDPGQMTHVFKIDDLKFLTEKAYGIIANSYEIKLLSSRLKIPENKLKTGLNNLIETLGKDGLKIYQKNKKPVCLKAVKPKKIIDPTGCGDAFRGGLLAGLARGLKLEEACKIGVLCATYKIEKSGTQNHKFNLAEFRTRYKKAFNEKCLI